MNIPQNIEFVREKIPEARLVEDGSITFECPVCRAEGHPGKHVKLYQNGALSCSRFASAGAKANREHCAPLRELLGLGDGAPPSASINEVLFGGRLTLECSEAGRGKARLVARNCSSLLARDELSLDRQAERAKFVASLDGFDGDERKLIHQALLKLADRFERVQAAVDEEADACDGALSVSFAALPDGRLVEQLASGFAVYDPAAGAVSYCGEIESDGATYRPLADEFIKGGGLPLPERLVEYGTEAELDRAIEDYIRRNLDLTDRDRKLSAAYIKFTYLYDKVLELPYLRPTGPRGNGKSRFVATVGGVCYRPVTVISPSAASLFRIVDRYHPCLIVDEANFNDAGDDTQALMQIMNAGYQRLAQVPRVEGGANGEFVIRQYDPYGPKLIASLKTTDSQAFESRCVHVQMARTARKDIRFRLSAHLLGEQAELRAKLTLWRLRNWHRDLEDLLDRAEEELKRHDIEPRYIQVSTPLYALIEDAALKAEFVEMLKGRDAADAEERRESFDGQLARAVHELLFDVAEDGSASWRTADNVPPPGEGQPCELATVERVTEEINSDLSEKKRHDAKWVGRQVRKLGFKTREVNRRQSPAWKKSAVVLDRQSFARVFGLFSLPLPGDFDPVNPVSGASGKPLNEMRRPDQIPGGPRSETDPVSANACDNSRLGQVTGLTGSKMPETEGEYYEEPSSGQPEADADTDAAEFVALDTETERFDAKRGVTPRTAKMIGLALCYDGERADYETDAAAWPLLLPEPEQAVVMHNAKFDLGVLARTGLPLPERWEDTLIAAHLLDECGAHGLKPLAQAHLGVDEPLTFEEADRLRLLDPAVFEEYARNDARYTYRLWPKFRREMERQGLLRVYELEKAVLPVVLSMEATGMKLDLSQMGEMRREVEAETKRVEAEVYEHAGCKFDLHSPQKVAAILFDKLGVPSHKTTDGGQRSVDRPALEEVRGYHPAVDAVLRYREVDKLASTFLATLPKFADAEGRIHPEFKPLGAKTGRFSCSDPNVQQIPSRSELGKRLRRMFVADEGNALVVADWSQMELRILAHYSRDPLLLEAYTSEQERDLHALTASRMFSKEVDSIEKSERTVAKMINFGIAYGITPVGLFNRLRPAGVDVTEADCERFVADYFKTYPGVRRFLDKAERAARERGYVRSLFGRRRRLKGGERGLSSREVRQAQNFIIQATAADLAKDAMVRLHAALPEGASLIATIHDEFIVECRAEQAQEVRSLMLAVMQHTPDGFAVPMKVDAHVGENWGACK